MESHRTLLTAALRLRERQRRIITTNTPTNTSKIHTRRIITGPTTKPIRLSNSNHRGIRKWRTQRRLIPPRRFARHWVSHAQIPLEDDISRTGFFAAGAEEEHEAASLVLSRCGYVEACKCAFVVGRDEGGLTGGEGMVGLFL